MMDVLIGTKNQYKATEMAYFLGDNQQVKIHFWEELNLQIKEEKNEVRKQGAEVKRELQEAIKLVMR